MSPAPAHPGPTGLPIEECIPSIRGALASVGVAVVQAEPGAGKSTVVPLRLIAEPWLGDGRIVMLEPRRLATRATARRMAFLLGEEVGATVGYRTREESRVGRSTRIEVVTEGILTRRIQRDPTLTGIGLVIFDEVHERNLQSDLALALTLDVRGSLRGDLAVLAMSATLDVARTAALLGQGDSPAPVITSTGRSHPVEVRWVPGTQRQRIAEATASAVRTALGRDPGDVLVFLPGAAEIRRVAGLLATAIPIDVDVRPLFGGLTSVQQDAALAPSPAGRRRVVLSTDIAETSLTVEGVRVVIDAGEVRRPQFDHRSGLTRLRTAPSSRASADQRSGRAGRTEPGVGYRLWAEAEHGRRPPYAEPEIRTADLAGLAIELAMWGATADQLPFLDPPPSRRLQDAQRLLHQLGALDASGRPTESGRALGDLPLHPRLGHMVIRAAADGHGWLACVLASLLEDRDVLRGHPSEVPIDVEERVRLVVDPQRFLAGADRGALTAARRRAGELARRARISRREIEVGASGRILALAYPDRIAQAIGGGQFRTRLGVRVATPSGDPLSAEPFLVIAETGPASHGQQRGSGPGGGDIEDQVRIAAALDREDLDAVAGADISTTPRLVWDTGRDDLELRSERRLGAIVLSSTTGRAAPGEDTTAALVERVRDGGLGLLAWTAAARALQRRIGFARRSEGDPWPDASDTALLATLDDWLAPRLEGATRRADLERVDISAVLRSLLGHRLVADLDRAVPATTVVPSGRTVHIDYDSDPPSISVKPQEMFGSTGHPTITRGHTPLAVHLLSPAGRVVQITSDLPGFWAGTWSDVRKELAGRYPRHEWPVDPTNASPGGGPIRRGRAPR